LTDEEVRILDLKTSSQFDQEAKKQLEIYKEIVSQVYPDRDVSTEIFKV